MNEDLQAAFTQRDFERLRTLLGDETVDVNGGETNLLHHACGSGLTGLVQALLNHPEIEVNHVDESGSSPFLIACWGGMIEVVKLLLGDARVDINLPNEELATPLWFAAFLGFLDVIRWMIASGRELDFDKRSLDGTNPIEAARNNEKTRVADFVKLVRSNPKQAQVELLFKLGLEDFPVVTPPKLTMEQYREYLATCPLSADKYHPQTTPKIVEELPGGSSSSSAEVPLPEMIPAEEEKEADLENPPQPLEELKPAAAEKIELAKEPEANRNHPQKDLPPKEPSPPSQPPKSTDPVPSLQSMKSACLQLLVRFQKEGLLTSIQGTALRKKLLSDDSSVIGVYQAFLDDETMLLENWLLCLE